MGDALYQIQVNNLLKKKNAYSVLRKDKTIGIQKAIISSNGHDFISSSLSVKNPKEIKATVKAIILN